MTLVRVNIFVFILATLFGCSQSENNKGEKEVRLYLQTSPLSLDPRIGGNRMSQTIIRQLFEGLFRVDSDGCPKPALAKSVIVSEDGCVYTVELHPSTWSNGEEVTAHDFEYAWKSILNPSFPSSFSYVFYDIKNANLAYQEKCALDDVGITALDSHTLQVVLEYPCPFFPELLTFPFFSPLCRSHCQQEDAIPEEVSNGPFVLKKHDLNSQVLIEKNPHYWGSSPAQIDKISFTVIEDPQTAYNMFCKGDLDWFGTPCGDVPLDIVRELGSESLQKRDVGQCTWLRCQMNDPLLCSHSIRKAIATAIDREAICNRFLECGDVPSQTALAQSLSLLSSPPFTDGDVQEAQRLFNKGLEELGILKEDCPPLSIQYRCDDQVMKGMAELIQQQIEGALGIKVILQDCDYGSLISRFFSKDFQLCLIDWCAFYQDAFDYLRWFKHEYPEESAYSEILAKTIAVVDLLERQRYLKEFEETLMDRLQVIPIIHKKGKYMTSSSLRGEAWTQAGHIDFKWLEKTG